MEVVTFQILRHCLVIRSIRDELFRNFQIECRFYKTKILFMHRRSNLHPFF